MVTKAVLVMVILSYLMLGLANNNVTAGENSCEELLSRIAEKIRILKRTLNTSTTYYKGYNRIVRVIDNYIQNNYGNLSCRELALINEIIDAIILDILESTSRHNVKANTITKTSTTIMVIKNSGILYSKVSESKNSSTESIAPLDSTSTVITINTSTIIPYNLTNYGGSLITSIQLNKLVSSSNLSHRTLTVGLGVQTVVTSIITIVMLLILLIIMFKPRI